MMNDTFFTLQQTEMNAVQAIQNDGPLSRTDLARILGYSRASITAVISELINRGILHEVGEGASGGGRRPLLLDVNPAFGFVAGIDIGATSIDLALADFRGNILERTCESTDVRSNTAETVLGRAVEMLHALIEQRNVTPDQVIAIGVGVPGPVHFARGVLFSPPLMPSWDGFEFKPYFRQQFPNARVVVDNDVNIMAKGEQQAGAGQGVDNFMFIKIGTGIGAGIISNGRIYRGSDGCAGDVGHICVDYNGPTCNCGNLGCLEVMAAAPAIAAAAKAGAAAGKSELLAKKMEELGGELTAVEVGEAAAVGDELANQVIRESGRMIGGVLATLANFYNPRAIFIGGGISKIGYRFLSAIRRAALRRANPLATRQLRIEYTKLGDDAGVVGAIWIAIEHTFVVQK